MHYIVFTAEQHDAIKELGYNFGEPRWSFDGKRAITKLNSCQTLSVDQIDAVKRIGAEVWANDLIDQIWLVNNGFEWKEEVM